ncbi:F-box domain, Skp2-like protein [Metarhizium album ARSEF 1941]|uniref:F-box domain, Skp2-like protein n=1 Tax=Metarhizium album (strain ARSEF 1941) TaxID=1081103 RepID=A0A0B2WZP3_METAS|nr:F-box domain, Skp2-like protein [Metarhizium album ARSEF 1941]KHN99059.1 F-box domain, Skp2-like protein [Metarhizium album ARSEF 1941]
MAPVGPSPSPSPSRRRRRAASVPNVALHARRRDSSPGPAAAVANLPPELIFHIFDLLDPIDCACLGLTNRRFYAVLRHLYGSVPLSCRRLRPSRQPSARGRAAPPSSPPEPRERERERERGRDADGGAGFCHHCGAHRCELHRHLYCWMGVRDRRSEYCSVADRFLPPAAEGPVRQCYVARPGWPRRCGKHLSGNPASSTRRRPVQS